MGALSKMPIAVDYSFKAILPLDFDYPQIGNYASFNSQQSGQSNLAPVVPKGQSLQHICLIMCHTMCECQGVWMGVRRGNLSPQRAL